MIPGRKSASTFSARQMYNIHFIVIVFFLSVVKTERIKEKSETKNYNDIMHDVIDAQSKIKELETKINITQDGVNDLKQGNEKLKDEVNSINAEILQLKLMRDDMNNKISELATPTIQRQNCVGLLQNNYSLPGLYEQITQATNTKNWKNCIEFLENNLCRHFQAYEQVANVKPNEPLPLEAAELGYLELIKVLVENGLEINRRYSVHFTMLHYASKYGNTDVLYYLLRRGADTGVTTDGFNYTPLHEAALTNKLDATRLLTAFGADINFKNIDGNTPLHLAAEKGNIGIMEHLLKYKDCDDTIKNNNEETAYDIAMNNGYVLVDGKLTQMDPDSFYEY